MNPPYTHAVIDKISVGVCLHRSEPHSDRYMDPFYDTILRKMKTTIEHAILRDLLGSGDALQVNGDSAR